MKELLEVQLVVVIPVVETNLHPSRKYFHGHDFDDISSRLHVCTSCCNLVRDIPTKQEISRKEMMCFYISW